MNIQKANRLNHVEEYYFSKKLKEVRLLINSGRPVINMAIGSPDLQPDIEVVTALKKSLGDPNAHRYQSYQGLPELREAMAQFYSKNYGVALQVDSEILPLLGSKEGIFHISMAFLNPGDEVLIPNPGYPTYSSVTKLVGAVPRYFELSEQSSWLPNLSELRQQNLDQVKLMWINYPNMPTGANARLKDLDQIVQFCIEHNILLVHDNPYSFILTEKPISILEVSDAKQIALELNSLSKSFNISGWRVGMLCGKQEYIDEVMKVKSNMDSGMFYGIQKGAIEALQLSSSWFEQLNSIYKERKEAILELVHLLDCSADKDSSGMFVWAKLPRKLTQKSEEFTDWLLYEHDIFITPGTVFGSRGEGFVRFSLCVPLDQIQLAINKFKQ